MLGEGFFSLSLLLRDSFSLCLDSFSLCLLEDSLLSFSLDLLEDSFGFFDPDVEVLFAFRLADGDADLALPFELLVRLSLSLSRSLVRGFPSDLWRLLDADGDDVLDLRGFPSLDLAPDPELLSLRSLAPLEVDRVCRCLSLVVPDLLSLRDDDSTFFSPLLDLRLVDVRVEDRLEEEAVVRPGDLDLALDLEPEAEDLRSEEVSVMVLVVLVCCRCYATTASNTN